MLLALNQDDLDTNKIEPFLKIAENQYIDNASMSATMVSKRVSLITFMKYDDRKFVFSTKVIHVFKFIPVNS